jgi:hypothetical protein
MRLLIAALILAFGALPAGAQWLDRPTPNIPRSADGKPNLAAATPRGADGHPDLTGLWNGPVPEIRADPANAQPWINDLVRQRQREYHKGRPSYNCLPSGPEADKSAGWKRILQTPTTIAVLNEDLTYRVIHMDGRELEKEPAPSWMGYSVGRWDGDTLVVQSNGFNDKTWLSRYGQSHTEALRVTERYRRGDFGHLHIDITFTDPGAYHKPWGYTADMELAADTEMLESICERTSDQWNGGAVAADTAVSVPPEVLAKYVGIYHGLYLDKPRTIEVSLAGDQLIAKVTGGAAIDGGEMRPLIPQSEILFDGAGIAYQFVVGANGVATALDEIHISGPSRFPKETGAGR